MWTARANDLSGFRVAQALQSSLAMKNFAGGKSLFLGLLLAGAVGGCDPGTAADDAPEPPDLINGRVCETHLSITGSFVASAPKPDDVGACWPVGTWTFTVTPEAGERACPDTSFIANQYEFTASRDIEDNETYVFDNDPTYERVRIKVSQGGSGLCEGGVEVYSPDGKIIVNMKPNLNADNSLTGQGEYEVYQEDQW